MGGVYHGRGLLQHKFGFWVILSGDTWYSPSYEKKMIKDQAYLSPVFTQTHKSPSQSTMVAGSAVWHEMCHTHAVHGKLQ